MAKPKLRIFSNRVELEVTWLEPLVYPADNGFDLVPFSRTFVAPSLEVLAVGLAKSREAG